MNKLFIILAIILVSCDKDAIIEEQEIPCECIKTVSKLETYTYLQNGTTHLGTKTTFMYKEIVPCQSEISGNMGGNIVFEIKCN